VRRETPLRRSDRRYRSADRGRLSRMHRPISLWPQIRRMKCRSPAVAITSLRPCSLGVNRPNGLSTCAAGTIVLDRCAALQLVRLRCAAWGYGAWRYAQGRGSFGSADGAIFITRSVLFCASTSDPTAGGWPCSSRSSYPLGRVNGVV
jgi:hypothetical protein